MRLAAIDVGTNSTKMIVADVSPEGTLSVISEQAEITRLGEGVDAARRLSDSAMTRTLEAIVRFVGEARAAGAETVLGAGTSALRDAGNGTEFLARIQAEADVNLEIITGDREAALAFAAVRSDTSLPLPAEASLLVFDIGGGSTELILGHSTGVSRFRSLDIGAVRLTERFLHSDPPTVSERAEAASDARSALATFLRPDTPLTVAGIGGTAVNIAAVTQGLRQPDPDAVHGKTVLADDVSAALARFAAAPLAKRRQIPGLEPKRADVLVAGALILDELLSYFQADRFLLSARGLRYGLLADYARPSR